MSSGDESPLPRAPSSVTEHPSTFTKTKRKEVSGSCGSSSSHSNNQGNKEIPGFQTAGLGSLHKALEAERKTDAETEKAALDRALEISALESKLETLSDEHKHCHVFVESAESKIKELEEEYKKFREEHLDCLKPAELKQQIADLEVEFKSRHLTKMEPLQVKLKSALQEALDLTVEKEKMEATFKATQRALELENETLKKINVDLMGQLAEFRRVEEKHIADEESWKRKLQSLLCDLNTFSEIFPDLCSASKPALSKAQELRSEKGLPMDTKASIEDSFTNLQGQVQRLRGLGTDLASTAFKLHALFWPQEPLPRTICALAEKLNGVKAELKKWRASGARVGADMLLLFICSWYENLNLNTILEMRWDSKWEKDPECVTCRQAVAYEIASYADTARFIEGLTEPDTDAEGDDEDEDDDEETESEDLGCFEETNPEKGKGGKGKATAGSDEEAESHDATQGATPEMGSSSGTSLGDATLLRAQSDPISVATATSDQATANPETDAATANLDNTATSS